MDNQSCSSAPLESEKDLEKSGNGFVWALESFNLKKDIVLAVFNRCYQSDVDLSTGLSEWLVRDTTSPHSSRLEDRTGASG